MIYVLIIGGLVLAATTAFGWPVLSDSRTEPLREEVLGGKAAQAMAVAGGLAIAAVGAALLLLLA